jgi:CxxC motif-containing protein
MKEIICIACPKGCRLRVDEENNYQVLGNACPRGEAYGRKEAKNPTRIITSTVRLSGGGCRRCPVKTDTEVPKGEILHIMELLNEVDLQCPVEAGQIVLPDAAGTGANVIATKSYARNADA